MKKRARQRIKELEAAVAERDRQIRNAHCRLFELEGLKRRITEFRLQTIYDKAALQLGLINSRHEQDQVKMKLAEAILPHIEVSEREEGFCQKRILKTYSVFVLKRG